MELGEAISIAKRMTNVFQAFEQLEEFLKTVSASEAQSVNLRKQNDDLKSENARLAAEILEKKSRYNELSEEVMAVDKDVDVKRQAALQKLEGELQVAEKAYQDDLQALKENYDKFEADSKLRREALDQQVAEEQDRLAQLVDKRQQVQEQLDVLLNRLKG